MTWSHFIMPFVSWPHPEDTTQRSYRPRGSPASLRLPLCCLSLCSFLWMLWFSCYPVAELGPEHPDNVEMGLGTSYLSQMGRGWPNMICQTV